MSYTRIKICGITRLQDGLAAAWLGVDAIGLVFHPDSPRAVDIESARAIASGVPPFVTIAGVFMNAMREMVEEVLHAVPIDILQFHGEEDADLCESFQRPYIKAVPMLGISNARAYAARYANTKAFLLDSHSLGFAGGTGKTFAWDRIPEDLGRPVVLAGGLNPENVADGVRTVRPYGVDVSSGVEIKKGIKDYDLMQRFISEVRCVDRAES